MDVCFWHISTDCAVRSNVCCWGKSGHREIATRLPLLTEADMKPLDNRPGGDCRVQDDLTAFLYQRMRDYCIGMISSRWAAKGANVRGAGDLYYRPRAVLVTER